MDEENMDGIVDGDDENKPGPLGGADDEEEDGKEEDEEDEAEDDEGM